MSIELSISEQCNNFLRKIVKEHPENCLLHLGAPISKFMKKKHLRTLQNFYIDNPTISTAVVTEKLLALSCSF